MQQNKDQVVFLVGAGRSGTTLLYKILSLHPKLAYVSNYDNKFPKWFPSGLIVRLFKRHVKLEREMWFKKEGNAYLVTRRWLKRLFPAPSEAEAVYSRCGLPLHPEQSYQITDNVKKCLSTRFKHIQALSGCDAVVSKRTANNRRIPWLQQAIPDARYIHLIREGRDVAYSLSQVAWWPHHVTFWAGSTPAELEQKGVNPLEICAKNWVEEVNGIKKGLASIEKENILEMRYEDLLSQPLDELRKMTDFIGLTQSSEFEDAVNMLGLKNRPSAWKKAWTDTDLEEVTKHQEALLKELNYQ